MSSVRQLLLTHRLLPEQIIRLDAELFLSLEELAARQGRPVRDLVWDALVAAVRADHAQTSNDRRWAELTPRQRDVAALACLGYTNGEIAERLVISVNTVRSHMRGVLDTYHV